MELDEHPRKHWLMSTAFTLNKADSDAQAIWRAQAESKAKVNG
jgi:hypothetical protein